ncbi:MAG TPA: ABC transporter ATP-binding protein [Candidatus Saccharimonadales bacterium]|nr:ABC transporter ATP-binding protein [Candidatus Saccharimonadales bacterium]
MPIKAFRTFASRLAREPENADDMKLLRRYAAKALAWLVVTEFFLIATNYPSSFLLNVLTGDPLSRFIWGLDREQAILGLAALAFVVALALGAINVLMSSPRNSFEHKLWELMMRTGSQHMVRMDTAWHNEHGTGEKESILDKNYGWLWNLIDKLVFGVIPDFVRGILIAVGLLFIDWRFSALSIALTAAYILTVFLNSKKLNELSDEYRKEMKAANIYSSQTTDAVHEVKSRGLDLYRHRNLSGLVFRLYDSELTRHLKWAWVLFRQDAVLSLGAGATVWVAAESYDHGTSIGGVALGIGWILRVSNNLFRLTDLQHALNRGGPALRELNEFFATEPSIVSPDHPVYPERLEGRIDFREVSFGYNGGIDKQVKDVSFTIRPKAFVAFVGQTGSGKSTVIALLQRLYDICTGSVTVDGVDVRRMDLGWLRTRVLSVVSQNPRLFDGTIKDNIALGNLDASDEVILDAARKAGVLADDFLGNTANFPRGLQSLIGENGVKLSGGQKQRVALARAIIAQAAVLVLDEATSALDNATEKAIQAELDTLTLGDIDSRVCTVIAIAHRLTTTRRADVIYAMKDGRIVEAGTHDELMALEGYYWELWQSGSM